MLKPGYFVFTLSWKESYNNDAMRSPWDSILYLVINIKRGRRSGRRPRGVAVVVVMMMLLIVIGFTTASGLITHQNYTNAQGRERQLQARYAIRSGLATAMDRLNTDPTWAPSEASPFEDYLDPQNEVGFRVWLEGINLNSDTAVASTGGEMLERGQAALKVVALIDGREISSGFGGAEQTVIMMKPPPIFDHNIFDLASPILADAPPGAVYLSYDSGGRTMDSPSFGGTARVYGKMVVPPNLTMNNEAPGGSYDSIEVQNEIHVPYRFIPPEGVDEDSPPADKVVGADMTLAPGTYGDLYVDPGVTLTLERGGEYAFLGPIGQIELGADAAIVLDGPSTEPCVVYAHGFITRANCRVNMPASAGDPPRPKDFQLYFVGWRNCDSFELELGDGTEASLVMAGENARYVIGDNVRLFGSLYGILMWVGGGAQFHHDSALVGEILEGKTQWVLINQGQ